MDGSGNQACPQNLAYRETFPQGSVIKYAGVLKMEEAYEAICFQTGHLRIHVVERVRVERCATTSHARGAAGVRQTSPRRQEASRPQGGEASSPKASEDGLSRSASYRERPTALHVAITLRAGWTKQFPTYATGRVPAGLRWNADSAGSGGAIHGLHRPACLAQSRQIPSSIAPTQLCYRWESSVAPDRNSAPPAESSPACIESRLDRSRRSRQDRYWDRT